MNIKLTVPIVILLISTVLCYILSCEVDAFTNKYEAIFDNCPADFEYLSKDMCKRKATGATGATGVCTTNKDLWLDYPLCQPATAGYIKQYKEQFDDFYFTELTPSESLNSAGMYSPIDFSGNSGLPKVSLTDKRPQNDIKFYNNLLIAPSKDSSFATFIRDDKPYIVTPLSRFADYENFIIAIGKDYSKMGEKLPQSQYSDKFAKIQDQKWYLESNMNPFYPYNHKALTTEDGRVNAFVFLGKPYVYWEGSCTTISGTKPQLITREDPLYELMPTAKSYHNFPPVYKQPWFKYYFSNCEK